MSRPRFTVLAAGMLAAVAGSAAGQFRPERPLSGDYSRPLGRAPEAGGQGQSLALMSVTEGDDTCEIRIENGKVSCKINGEEVPADRIRKEDGRVTVLAEDGSVLKTFQVWDGAGAGAWGGFGPGGDEFARLFRVFPDAQGQGRALALAAPEGEPPKVMLGITMAPPPEALVEHYNMEPGDVFMIDRVVEGLPAEKAGLRKSDVVIEIDGHRPASTERLREIMKAKEVGDTIRLKVLREGEDKEFTVRLEAYDPGKLSVAPDAPDAPGATPWGQFEQFKTFPGITMWQDRAEIEAKVRRSIEEALKSLRDDQDLHRSVGEARRALEKALQEFERSGGEAMRRFQQEFGGGGGRYFFGDRPGMVFQVPEVPEPPASPAAPGQARAADERVRALKEENARLREEVESMRRDLADIKAMLKEMHKGGGG